MVIYRDMSVPYTEEELAAMPDLLRKLPHYKNERVYSEDIPIYVDSILRYERTPEQIKSYQHYWNEQFGGSISIDDFINYVRNLHKTHLFVRQVVLEKDKNKDGVISADEFAEILEMVRLHDPKFAEKTFEDFVREADTNKDGVVDVEECIKWIEKYSA